MTQADHNATWLAVDWGTTHLRAWAMGAGKTVIARRDSDRGMSRLTQDQFAPTLANLIGDLFAQDAPIPTFICGMAGAKQGWAEAPYAAVPCIPNDVKSATAFHTDRFQVHILSGVKQNSPADVMRGEETQIAGFLAQEPDFDGVICLPGTHSKWAHISAGEIVSFRTFMTGELFALLSQNSVLRHSIGTDWDQESFVSGLNDTLSRPSDLAAKLFGLRAESLLDDLPPAAARARLSALLIGAELAAAKPYWLEQNIVIIGASSLAAIYETALISQGVAARSVDAETMTLAGLIAAYLAQERAAT
ncbi:2-dehydro-3-deoxygalactonokinase [Pacificibacter maritimus]|uniref:2-dehydro-3-deoxygalactonokinase n=1 Tax=Pacificibacter maritimus TaxID=762213 RepID=A0A3N4UMW7_9RHOB|nr:2-dehydro-3-deoxygalactonokinase [Pacificibacter maritimus]RPE71368.1 2-dehydro-3-deoxygalactonokinase [Pacificibacter maritimus]